MTVRRWPSLQARATVRGRSRDELSGWGLWEERLGKVQPVIAASTRLERGLEMRAVDLSLDHAHSSRGKPATELYG